MPSTPPKGSWDKDLTLPLSVMIAESGTPDESVFLMDPIDPGLSPLSHRSDYVTINLFTVFLSTLIIHSAAV